MSIQDEFRKSAQSLYNFCEYPVVKYKILYHLFDTLCSKYPCPSATSGYQELEPRNITAEDVNWAILPYVPNQYGN